MTSTAANGGAGASTIFERYGVYSVEGQTPRVGALIGDEVVDLASALDDPIFDRESMNDFLSAGRLKWRDTHTRLEELFRPGTEGRPRRLESAIVRQDVRMHLPFEVADFVDFFSSIEHATNAGRILRPTEEALKPNWRHLPIGYHGRSGTVVASGTDVRRPHGQQRAANGDIVFGPTTKLDIEVELGFVVGRSSQPGKPVGVDSFKDHVFGAVLLLDWSARDIQAWEYVPLGPFLGKSFATSISPWVVPLDSLVDAEVTPAKQDPQPLPHLLGDSNRSYRIDLELKLNGCTVATPKFDSMYWTPAQQMAHMTSNGAHLRSGDLYGTGTISSWDKAGYGSLMELSWNGQQPFDLGNGEVRQYLLDGDSVSVTGYAVTADGREVDFGEVTGLVVSSRI